MTPSQTYDLANFHQLDFRIPYDKLQEIAGELALNHDLYDQIRVRQTFPGTSHSDTQTIYLRGPKAFTPEAYTRAGDSIDYGANLTRLMTLADEVVSAMRCLDAVDVGHVMVVALAPGGYISPHIDEGPYAEHYSRYHLVLTTNDQCVMHCGDESLHMRAGHLYWFNHRKVHAFENNGTSWRVHVIFDCVPTKGVRVNPEPPAKLPPMISIRHSSVDEMLQLAPVLFREHWEEIARNKQVMVLEPHEPAYRALEDAGNLLILAAFKGEELIGYSVNFVLTHPHYAALTVCQNDLLFIDPKHRQGGAGIRLMRRTEQEGKVRGAQLMLWHAKESTPLADMLPRMGYGVQDIIFSKEL